MENRIKEDINSRRAIAVTYDPKQDNSIEDIPCLIMLKLTFFNIHISTSNLLHELDYLIFLLKPYQYL